HGLHTVAQRGAAVAGDGVFNHTLVVVDEQARRRQELQFLPLALEVNARADRVRGATAKLSLIVNRRAQRVQIHFWRQMLSYAPGREQAIALIGYIGETAVDPACNIVV